MEKTEKVIIVKTKGFDGLDETALAKKNASWEKAVAEKKALWSMSDYLGFTGAGKGSGKQAEVIAQLSRAEDSVAAKRTLELIPEIQMMFNEGNVAMETASLKAYFGPYLKAKAGSVETATPEAFEGLSALNIVDGE